MNGDLLPSPELEDGLLQLINEVDADRETFVSVMEQYAQRNPNISFDVIDSAISDTVNSFEDVVISIINDEDSTTASKVVSLITLQQDQEISRVTALNHVLGKSVLNIVNFELVNDPEDMPDPETEEDFQAWLEQQLFVIDGCMKNDVIEFTKFIESKRQFEIIKNHRPNTKSRIKGAAVIAGGMALSFLAAKGIDRGIDVARQRKL